MTGEKATSAGRTIGGHRVTGGKVTEAGIAALPIGDRAAVERIQTARPTDFAWSARKSGSWARQFSTLPCCGATIRLASGYIACHIIVFPQKELRFDALRRL